MSARPDHEAVIERIYDTVCEPDRWNGALEAAADFLESDAMLLLYRNLSAGGPKVVESVGFDRQALGVYTADHIGSDELIHESMNGPAGVVVSSARSFRGKKFRSTANYRGLLEPSRLAHIAGAAALNTPKVYASLWMARSDRRPDFSVYDLHLFGRLLPHVARAMTVHHRVHQAEFEASLAVGVIDRVAAGVVLLDARGAPLMVNREAERILALHDGISLLKDGPVAAHIAETARLRDLIRQVGCYASPLQESARAGGGAVRLSRPSGRPDFHLVVMPLPRRCQPGDVSGAVAVLFITDPEKPQSPVDYLFGELYDLTDAEARLINGLLEGGGLTAAAERLGVSRNTAHSQLASVFQKTGTCSQTELVRLLLVGIAPVETPSDTSGFDIPKLTPDEKK